VFHALFLVAIIGGLLYITIAAWRENRRLLVMVLAQVNNVA